LCAKDGRARRNVQAVESIVLPAGVNLFDVPTMSAIPDYDETAHRNVICCLLALEIADYEAKAVFEQIRLTQDFRSLLSEATAGTRSDDLVPIVREDGALLSFTADPQECFATALSIREATLTQDRYRNLPLRIGINLGTVQIAEDAFGRPYVSGEGRQDADRVMRQGPPRQISVARQFVELLSRAAPELAGLLEYQGVFSDTVGPPLCLYRLPPPQSGDFESLADQPPTPARPSNVIDAPISVELAPQTALTQSTARRPKRFRSPWPRYVFLSMLAGAAMLIPFNRSRVDPPVLGSAAQPATAHGTAPEREFGLAARTELTRSAAVPRTEGMSARETPVPAVSPSPKSRDQAVRAARHIQRGPPETTNYVAGPAQKLNQDRKARADQPVTARPTQRTAGLATIYLAIKPWGTVYVDDREIGVTPPLKSFEITPGRRLITIKNSSLPAYRLQLSADPEAEITVAHDFACISDREKPCREGLGKGLELPSRFKLQTADAGR
jgi:hypothetical protein